MVACIAALWSWFETTIISDPARMGSEEAMAKIGAHLDKLVLLHDHLMLPASFVILFTLNECMNRWQETLTTMWALQDPIQATGFMLGSGFVKADRKHRPLGFKMYRYLNVIHILTYDCIPLHSKACTLAQ